MVFAFCLDFHMYDQSIDVSGGRDTSAVSLKLENIMHYRPSTVLSLNVYLRLSVRLWSEELSTISIRRILFKSTTMIFDHIDNSLRRLIWIYTVRW